MTSLLLVAEVLYSGMDLLPKCRSNTCAQGILHVIVKLDEIIIQNIYLTTLTSLLQTWNYFLFTKVPLAVIGLYARVVQLAAHGDVILCGPRH